MSQGRRRSPLPNNWHIIRRQVLHRDRHTCQLAYPHCTTRATEVDHINGHDDHTQTNLQAVCKDCHATKTGREARNVRPPRKRPPEPHPGLSHP